ncbi:hypothetical protein Tco_0117428 [Tanacetum coccineum]
MSLLFLKEYHFTNAFGEETQIEREIKSISEKENLTAQLVLKFQGIKRCNNSDVLQNIPCSPKGKIVGQILLNHPLSYALTMIADAPAVYLQQFWKIVSKLLVETPANPFITPATIRVIESFMQKFGYQGIVDKVCAFYMKFLANHAFLTDEIYATDDYAEYEMVFVKKKKRKQIAGEISSPRKSLKVTIKQKQAKNTPIPPPSDDKERDEIAEASLLIQEKLEEEEINKIVKGEDNEESYASEFADSMLNDDNEDFGTRIEPGSHKEHPKKIDDDDDDETEKEKKDDEKKDNVEDKDNDDHIHTLVGT